MGYKIDSLRHHLFDNFSLSRSFLFQIRCKGPWSNRTMVCEFRLYHVFTDCGVSSRCLPEIFRAIAALMFLLGEYITSPNSCVMLGCLRNCEKAITLSETCSVSPGS